MLVAVTTGLVMVAFAQQGSASTIHQGAVTPTRSLPALLRQHGHWFTFGGKRVWGVRVTLQVGRKRIVAHIASADSHRNRGSGLCMSSYPNTKGHEVDQYSCNGSGNQTWIYYQGTLAEPYLGAYGSPAGSLCLNNYGGGFSDGNKQALWSCSSNSSAMWYQAGISNFSGYDLVHLFDGPGSWSKMCLTTLGDTSQGSPIEEWTCNRGAANQSFDGNWYFASPG
jgi:hypothetical protein